jgi:GNAT superfamily N-acetyltransferase
MTSLAIRRVARLAGDDATALAVVAHAEMIADGLADPAFPMVNWDDGAIVAALDGEHAGIITFQFVEWRSELAIKLGFVDPKCRGRGVYRAMWRELVELAQGKGARRITGVTHANNTVMRTVAARLGRVEHSINLDFIVPPAAPVTGEAREATECHRIVVFNGRQVAVVAGAVE